MKKLLLILLLSSTVVSAQIDDLKGKIIIEPTIGVPNAGRTYLAFASFDYFYDETFEVTGSPLQFGGKLEYGISESVGIGFEVNYEEAGYERTIEGYNYNNITQLYEDTIISWSQTKLRMVGRFVFHFGNSEKADWYTGAALGYTKETQTNSDNELDPFDYTFAFFPKLIDDVSSPLSGRIYIGTRYMFSDNLGLNAEIGLGGGSILTLGLAVKI